MDTIEEIYLGINIGTVSVQEFESWTDNQVKIHVDEAYSAGYGDGAEEGYEHGYECGKTMGHENSYSQGYTEGYKDGVWVGAER